MDIKPANSQSSPVARVSLRADLEAPEAVQSARPNEELKGGDKVVLGNLGSTLFQGGKAMSYRDAQTAAQSTLPASLTEAQRESDFSGLDLHSTLALGGPESPCFYKGKVMTTREAQELAAGEKQRITSS
jgi:hypothetical protein